MTRSTPLANLDPYNVNVSVRTFAVPLRYAECVIFQAVRDERPYPAEAVREGSVWSDVPPTMVRLDELTTTRSQLDLGRLLADDSTFYGDIFAHVVRWKGQLYLEDGLYRALRAALAGRPALHARVLDLDAKMVGAGKPLAMSQARGSQSAAQLSAKPGIGTTRLASEDAFTSAGRRSAQDTSRGSAAVGS